MSTVGIILEDCGCMPTVALDRLCGKQKSTLTNKKHGEKLAWLKSEEDYKWLDK